MIVWVMVCAVDMEMGVLRLNKLHVNVVASGGEFGQSTSTSFTNGGAAGAATVAPPGSDVS